MYIKEVEINNFRGFEKFKVTLSKLSVIIGENDSGKSNFIEALSLPLSGNNLNYNRKRLSISDVNTKSILRFYQSIKNNESEEKQLSKIPKVSVTIKFADPIDNYEKQIISKWISEASEEDDLFIIRYDFKPKNDVDLISAVRQTIINQELNDLKWFTLPIELYDFRIVSSNNERAISFNDLKNIVINTINAERDDFSDSMYNKSNSVLTNLLIAKLNDSEKNKIDEAYVNFFDNIKSTNAFDKIMQIDDTVKDLEKYLQNLSCTPNLPNLKSIISNITISHGDKFLYQKGLGERNLIYLFLLFAHYKISEKYFNLCCIEEPESHLCVKNRRLAIDYITKSTENSNSLLQTIITTHNTNVINKLKLNNLIVFSGNKAINIKDVEGDLTNYLRKRPNFDILKLLFAKNIILVEGPTEEMFINSWLSHKRELSDIEVISIGQKGYKTFMNIWLEVNCNNPHKKIGIVRDFDNQPNAKKEHDEYDIKHSNIIVRTTTGYTLEDDIVSTSENFQLLRELFNLDNTIEKVVKHLKDGKTEGMLTICDNLGNENFRNFMLPKHIEEVINSML